MLTRMETRLHLKSWMRMRLTPKAPHAPKAAMAIELWAEKRAQLENGEIDVNEYEDWKASL